jgi:hypothetical protein
MIQGLMAKLEADDAVRDALPGGIYPVLLPQDAVYPCVTYQVISDVPDYELGRKARDETCRLQMDVRSNTTYAAADTGVRAIRNCLESFTGDLLDGTSISDIRVEDVTDYYDAANLAFRKQVDFIIDFTF